jgi:hypothetical protein
MQEVHTSNLSRDIINHDRVFLLILSVPQEKLDKISGWPPPLPFK